MIHRGYQPPADAAWYERWKQRADEAKQAALDEYAARAAGRKPQDVFKSAVWGDLKDHLVTLFRHKCAYCEGRCESVARFEVEHFRPKRKVTEDLTHPGYYWLAYEPTNLLPSCPRCNGGGAKMNQFPLSNGSPRVSEPGPLDALQQESPLLLNPYEPEDPALHLRYTDIGTVEAVTNSLRGETSIRVYDLNREALMIERHENQKYARLRIGNMVSNAQWQELRDYLNKIDAGDEQFSAAVRACLAPGRKIFGV
jgi:uncharacterized protein (TIGR02646 family)